MKQSYQLSLDEVFIELTTSGNGLSKAESAARQEKYGQNKLQEAKKKSKFSIFLSQFKDVMIIILIGAAAISFLAGEHTDAFVILAIIFGNAWIGFSQENNAEKSMRMLQQMAAQHALVLRDGHPVKIEAAELVPGDVVILEAGDVVPADARLIELNSFKTEEAALTGESHSIEKIISVIPDSDLLPGDQRNMVFKGTMVSNGSAKAVVTATGMDTEIGKISGLLDIEDQKTPLQKRLAAFSKQLTLVVIAICILVFGIGLWRGEPAFHMFLTALSLAVAALPEALPAVITIALAQGARRMVKQKALMRRLPAVETLGSVTYICSDKTGTLTQNKMSVEKMDVAPGMEELFFDCMMLNNEVSFTEEGEILGDSTETALVHHSLLKGCSREDSEQRLPQVDKLPFDSVRMKMSTLHRYQDKWVLLIKGAPTKIAETLSAESQDKVAELLDLNRQWAASGLRVLFFAYKIFDEKPGMLSERLEQNLEYLGATGMIDPPREEVIEAIKECKSAGIKTVMITGDQPLTAHAISMRLEMADEDALESIKTGADLIKTSPEEFIREVENVSIYARVSPEQKLNIVKALQERGAFVAMTGDGVNDAPSLKQADIGVAMGITGTDVSKEASDMILLDDNFATIVKAVREGRRIYDNIKKFILYVLSCNLAEILTILLAPMIGLGIPLLPIHILWINLITDGLPGLALTAEPAEKDIMKRPPRPPKENLFAGGMIPQIITTAIILAAGALYIQIWAAGEGYSERSQQTMVFTLLSFMQLGNALAVRSVDSLFNRNFFSNPSMLITVALSVILQLSIVYLPILQPIFKTTTLDAQALQMILLITGLGILGIEIIKYMKRRKTVS